MVSSNGSIPEMSRIMRETASLRIPGLCPQERGEVKRYEEV
jgi:hypothetical protein